MALFVYPATQVSISGGATEAKQDVIITELQQIEADVEVGNVSLASIESDISDLNSRIAGNLVPETFDFIAITYVTVGNGIGEIETVTYKTGGAGGTTVAVLTLAYDSSDRLSTVTRS